MDFLIELSLILFLTFGSNGHTWNVNVTRHFNVTSGSDVTVQCTFSYPEDKHRDDVQIFWKKKSKEKIAIKDNDRNPFIFHPMSTYIIEKYRGRTELIGNANEGNCSLKIRNVTENESNIYLRIAVNDSYSFFSTFVSISVSGVAPVIIDPVSPGPLAKSTKVYIAVSVSLVATLIIIAAGIVFFKKRRSLTREESSYYVNFKVSSIPANRDTALKKQDRKELSEQKVIDDPVYINLEVHPGQLDPSVANADNIYANVDYTR